MEVYNKNALYTFLRIILVNPIISISNGTINILGKEKLPKDGAVIIGCNHTCTLTDALVILRAMNRATVFMTRADIFRRPLLRRIFTFLKMLPIFRIRDGYAAVKQNEEVINKCVTVLEHNYPLALFPEAKHRPKHSLLPLSKGIFHIALESIKKFGTDRPVYIVPMGLEYHDYFHFRRGVTVTFGDPINVTEWVKKMEGEGESQRILPSLRDELAHRMSTLISFIPDTADYEAQWTLTELRAAQRHHLMSFEQLKVRQGIIKEILEEKESQPSEITQKKYHDVLEYKKKLQLHGIEYYSTGLKHPICTILWRTLLLILLFPYYLVSTIWTIPSWGLSHFILKKVKDKAFSNTARFGVNLIIYPILVAVWSIVLTQILHINIFFSIMLVYFSLGFFYDYNALFLRALSDCRWIKHRHLHSQIKRVLK